MIAAVLAIQCLCSLIYLVRRKRTIKRDDTRSKMIIMVPCYNEGHKELRKTIDRYVCLKAFVELFEIDRSTHMINISLF